jgi:hypothetical protein
VEGLTDAASAGNRFTYKIDAKRHPEETSSARDFEQVVTKLLVKYSLKRTIIREVFTSR